MLCLSCRGCNGCCDCSVCIVSQAWSFVGARVAKYVSIYCLQMLLCCFLWMLCTCHQCVDINNLVLPEPVHWVVVSEV